MTSNGYLEYTVSEFATFREALQRMNKSGVGTIIIVDNLRRVKSSLSDGDIRRALLDESFKIDDPVYKRPEVANQKPIVLKIGYSVDEAVKLSHKYAVIPVIDRCGQVVDVFCRNSTGRIPILEPTITELEIKNVLDTLQTGWVSSQGPQITIFEEEFGKLIKGPFCVCTSNGTSALTLALITLGVSHGDYVLVPNLTFGATANAVLAAGANPILIDINQYYSFNEEQLREAYFRFKPKAIMPVHLYGFCSDTSYFYSFINPKECYVIEDCAEFLGGTSENNAYPSDARCFSFFANKTITTGEGGMIAFREQSWVERARIIRDHGMDRNRRYYHVMYGQNMRMTCMQASLGLAQLTRFDEIHAKKKALWCRYYEEISKKDYFDVTPFMFQKGTNSYWLFTLCMSRKDQTAAQVIEMMRNNGIDVRPIFIPLHQCPAFKQYSVKDFSYRTSIRVSQYGFCLPSSYSLSNSSQTYILDKLFECIDANTNSN